MTRKTELPPIPPAMEDVAMIDAPTIAAAAAMSLSGTLAALKRDGIKPRIQRPRFTRYALTDIKAWLASLQARQTTETAAAMTQQARKASAAAKAKATALKAAGGTNDGRA